MKRKLFAALTSVALIGAALWGVNYRLDHPPLSQADKEFRALVAGADRVEVREYRPRDSFVVHPALNVTQARELAEQLRLLDAISSPLPTSSRSIIDLTFWKHNQRIADFSLDQTSRSSWLIVRTPGPLSRRDRSVSMSSAYAIYDLHPRFNKRLNRVLDAYLPQRVRP